MDDDDISGAVERIGPTRLQGWCWSSARPKSQLAVDILLDDEPVATVTAGLFRRDLARAGKGDGRCAFDLDFGQRGEAERARLDAAATIGLRESGSGKIVGRLRQKSPRHTRNEHLRLDGAHARLGPIIRAASAPLREGPAAALRRAFAELGDQLAARAAGPAAVAAMDPIGAALQRLRRTLPPIRLPIIGAPALSLIFAAGHVHAMHRMVAALAPGLSAARGEVLAIDDGADPAVALLPTVIANLALVRAGPGFAAAGNAAAAVARGDRIAFVLHDGEIVPEPGDARVAVGAPVLALAARLGVLDLLAAEQAGDEQNAPLLTLPRRLFADLGGLDPLFGDDPALCALDLALKAALLGHPVVASSQRWPTAPASAHALSGQFLHRWRRTA